MERGAGSPAKAVDSLIGIANAENVRFGSREGGQNLDLCEVGVLKFVHKNKGEAGSLPRQSIFVAGQQIVGARNHVAERAQILFAKPDLRGGKYPGNFLAASYHLVVAQLVPGLRNPRNR